MTNEVGEAEAWIAFDGDVTVATEGGVELAGRLAARYWDLTDPAMAARLEGWRVHPEAFALLELVPTRIRSGS